MKKKISALGMFLILCSIYSQYVTAQESPGVTSEPAFSRDLSEVTITASPDWDCKLRSESGWKSNFVLDPKSGLALDSRNHGKIYYTLVSKEVLARLWINGMTYLNKKTSSIQENGGVSFFVHPDIAPYLENNQLPPAGAYSPFYSSNSDYMDIPLYFIIQTPTERKQDVATHMGGFNWETFDYDENGELSKTTRCKAKRDEVD